MIPTLVIGLREGVEASLIVGIVAAFLSRRGRSDVLRWVWAGVGLAVLLCAAVAVALQLVEGELPQRGQEGLETVVGLAAVGMVTYMIVWMRRHARAIKHALEDEAARALASGSTMTLVGMAFLAVLREGFETTVFLFAIFKQSSTPVSAGAGAGIGLLAAVGIGYGIYRGGVRLNMARFFRFTAAVLVVVAAGLLASAGHTAHEAGWLNFAQAQALNLRWLVRPGTAWASLVTGMLGIQAEPTRAEAFLYALYLVPMLAFVLWPARRGPRQGTAQVASAGPSGTIAAKTLPMEGA